MLITDNIRIIICQFLVLIFGVGTLWGCSAGSPQQVYEITTINEIQAAPWSFHGKTVRVLGTFDECAPFTCLICKGKTYPNSNDKCMGVSFESPYLDAYARHSTALIEAEYDAGCSGVLRSAENSNKGSGLCTDRASEFLNTRVIKIVTRRAASQGHINMYGVEPLRVPEKGKTKLLKSAFIKQISPASNIEISDLEFAFLLDISKYSDLEEYKTISAMGGVCICEEGVGKCNNIWPKLEGHIYNLPAHNPYKCWVADEINGVWRYSVPQ